MRRCRPDWRAQAVRKFEAFGLSRSVGSSFSLLEFDVTQRFGKPPSNAFFTRTDFIHWNIEPTITDVSGRARKLLYRYFPSRSRSLENRSD